MTSVKANDLSYLDLSNAFYYCPESPTGLRHATSKGTRKKGDVAGSYKKSIGYYTVGFRRKVYLVSRVIWQIVNGEISQDDFVDHVDGNRLNNTISNLRKVGWDFNARNAAKRKDNTTGMTGVSINYQRGVLYYVARVERDGKAQCRAFSSAKYGVDEAFKLACEAREQMINNLNSEGYGYTERHGNDSI